MRCGVLWIAAARNPRVQVGSRVIGREQHQRGQEFQLLAAVVVAQPFKGFPGRKGLAAMPQDHFFQTAH